MPSSKVFLFFTDFLYQSEANHGMHHETAGAITPNNRDPQTKKHNRPRYCAVEPANRGVSYHDIWPSEEAHEQRPTSFERIGKRQPKIRIIARYSLMYGRDQTRSSKTAR